LISFQLSLHFISDWTTVSKVKANKYSEVRRRYAYTERKAVCTDN